MATPNKAEWGTIVLSVVTVLSVMFGAYGTYTSDQASQEIRIIALEKELEVFTESARAMEDELDVLWVDTGRNAESIKVIRKDQERFDAAFLKFAEATDRLSVSVARLEEHMRIDEMREKSKEN